MENLDSCNRCSEGYFLSYGKTECVSQAIPGHVANSIIVSQSFLGLSIAIGLSQSVILGASISTMFNLLNQFQLLVLIPMLGAYLPSKIIEFLQGLKISMFSFDTKYIKDIPVIDQLITSMNFTQPDEYLLRIDFDSGSTLVNNACTVLGMFLTIILHL